MLYKVILIESRLPTHSWIYEDEGLALRQLCYLLSVYAEVNDVSATIVKMSYEDRNFSNSDLIRNQVL